MWKWVKLTRLRSELSSQDYTAALRWRSAPAIQVTENPDANSRQAGHCKASALCTCKASI